MCINESDKPPSTHQELDLGYRYVVEVILNLNHDRYKSYFNYFIILHLGIVTVMLTKFSESMADGQRYLGIVGVFLGFCWLGVLHKIQQDIKKAWSLIEKYENSAQYTQEIKVSDTVGKGFKASQLMLFIPIGFLAFYLWALKP